MIIYTFLNLLSIKFYQKNTDHSKESTKHAKLANRWVFVLALSSQCCIFHEIIFSCKKKNYNLFVNKKKEIYNLIVKLGMESSILAENNL